MAEARVSGRFPDFPWDTIAAAKARAAEHPDGLVDLSIGTPVDPTPEVARQALIAAADSPGYPTVLGPVSLRQAVVDWLERRFSITGVGTDNVLATIGSKELVAWLPVLLGLGPGDVVGFPGVAYPTYDVGARLAGATPQVVDGLAATVRSSAGEVEVPVEVSDEMMPGVVSLPHGWGHGLAGTRLSVANEHAGVNSNLLAPPDLFDPISNNAAVNGIPVEVAAATD